MWDGSEETPVSHDDNTALPGTWCDPANISIDYYLVALAKAEQQSWRNECIAVMGGGEKKSSKSTFKSQTRH